MIVSDVRNYGPLDSFSAFTFENYLHQIKTLVKSHARALQQVVRRITERKMVKANEQKLASAKLSGKHSNGPLTQGFDGEQYSRLETKDTVLGLSRKDNCVKMIDGNIVWIANILHSPQGVNICGFFFTKVDNLYTQPISSSTLNVYIASEVSATCAPRYGKWKILITNVCAFHVEQAMPYFPSCILSSKSRRSTERLFCGVYFPVIIFTLTL